MGVRQTVEHGYGGGIYERGKGARGHPGTWESHLALHKVPGKVATGLSTTGPETGAPPVAGVRQKRRHERMAQAQ
jgi:hypothetical protein